MTERNTQSKQAVLLIINQAKSSICADDLLAKMSINVNRTTIYRILEKFEQKGIIHKIIGIDQKAYYSKCVHQGCSNHHHFDSHAHFQCKKCYQVVCLDNIPSIPHIPNLKIEAQQTLLIGECEACQTLES